MSADATWFFSSDSVQNPNPPRPQCGKCAAVLRKEDRNRRPSPSTNDSVLLLLWTLAACRGLWRGRYVHWISSLLTWCLCVRLFLSPLSLGGKGSVPRVSFEFRAEAAAWQLRTPLFISASSLFLHECVLPGDEGDQDGSLYFLPRRCCLPFSSCFMF